MDRSLEMFRAAAGLPRPQAERAQFDWVASFKEGGAMLLDLKLPHGEPFAPCCPCPRCKTVDLHWLRTPRHCPEYRDAQASLDKSMSWLGCESTNRLMLDESEFAVVRRCRSCGYQWDQS